MSDLIERLRGKYVIPINDGAGPLDGSMEFIRQFPTPPIHHEAADALEANAKRIAELEADNARLRVDGERYLAAFNWALGCGDEFSTRELGQGPFYWRSQLAERAGLVYNGKEYAAKEQS